MATLQEIIEKLETYGFECQAGPLEQCIDWSALKQQLAQVTQERGQQARLVEMTLAVHEQLSQQFEQAQARITALEARGVEPLCEHVWGTHTHGAVADTTDAVCIKCGWCPNQQRYIRA